MLANSAGDDTLVVFDKYQGCPPLSKLPTSYEAQVAELSGVAETTPTLFLLSACSGATDRNKPDGRTDDLLTHLPLHPNAPGDLQITVTSGGLDSKKHLWRSWTLQI
jgi:hypothetical protein